MARAYFKGAEEMKRKLANVRRNFRPEVLRAILEEAEIEKTESMERTPVDTGTLRSSHQVLAIRGFGRVVGVVIQVGGPSIPYALRVHEDLDAFHKVGQAKFLESTLMESRPHMAARIAARIDFNRMV